MWAITPFHSAGRDRMCLATPWARSAHLSRWAWSIVWSPIGTLNWDRRIVSRDTLCISECLHLCRLIDWMSNHAHTEAGVINLPNARSLLIKLGVINSVVWATPFYSLGRHDRQSERQWPMLRLGVINSIHGIYPLILISEFFYFGVIFSG